MPKRIAPTQQTPEPMPQTSGAWVRDADGGLRPLDAATAAQAGLDWPADLLDPPADPPTDHPAE